LSSQGAPRRSLRTQQCVKSQCQFCPVRGVAHGCVWFARVCRGLFRVMVSLVQIRMMMLFVLFGEPRVPGVCQGAGSVVLAA
jgi:hypothetical protein